MQLIKEPNAPGRKADAGEMSGLSPLLGDGSKTKSGIGSVSGEGFGEKDIGLLGGLSLLWNNVRSTAIRPLSIGPSVRPITGPAMVALAGVYLNAGWLPATLLLAIVGIMSGFGGGFLIEAMSRMPGNAQFDERMEMMYLARKVLGTWAYRVTIILFVVNLQLSNITAIIQSTQTADYTIMAIAGKTCGVSPRWNNHPQLDWHCVNLEQAGAANSGTGSAGDDGLSDSDSPFGAEWVLSFGFVIVLLVTIPLGYYNLDDNIFVQIVAAGILVFFTLIGWFYGFMHPEHLDWDGVASFGPSNITRCSGGTISCATQGGLGSQVGPIVFNYAYVVTLPSWINEMKPGLPVNLQLWGALIPGIITFVVLGWVSAAFYQTAAIPDSEDLLSGLTGDSISKFTQAASFVFPPAALISGIPIFSIVIRYNLLENGIANVFWSNMWAVVFPWVVALVFYAGSEMNNLMNYVSLISTIPLNLTVPCYLFIRVAETYPTGTRLQEINSSYKAVPCLSDARSIQLAWVLIALSIVGNVAAIVFSAITGGLQWQS